MAIRIEKQNRIWTVVHSRPEARNAMDPESADALVEAFAEFDRSPDADVAVLWGEGPSFCAGWDLKYAASLEGQAQPLAHLDFPADGQSSAAPRGPLGPTRLELSKPVIAAIEGAAVAGGMELALWCDLRVMAQDAFVGVYCRRWGIPLLDGGTVRLPRLVGQGRALEIILTGRKVPADECHRIGFCERLAPPGRAREVAEELAAEIARFPQDAVRSDMRSVYRQHGLRVRPALESEWRTSVHAVGSQGASGAGRFKSGKGRHGDFKDI